MRQRHGISFPRPLPETRVWFGDVNIMGNTQEDGFTHESCWEGPGSPCSSWRILGHTLWLSWGAWVPARASSMHLMDSQSLLWSGVGMCRDHQELPQDFPGFSTESPALQEAAQSLATPMSLFPDIAGLCFGGWNSSHSNREDPCPQRFNSLTLPGEDKWIPSCINQKIYQQYWEVNINTLPSRFSDGENEVLLC